MQAGQEGGTPHGVNFEDLEPRNDISDTEQVASLWPRRGTPMGSSRLSPAR